MVLLVRFGELALKSRFVRRQLRDRLVANIQDLFAAEGIECLTRADHGRIYVDVDDVSFSTAQETSSDPKDIAEIAIRLARERVPDGGSFAIRPRRSGTHPYTSQDLAKGLGRQIQEAFPKARVDLDSPDTEIHVEVRENRAFVFTDIVYGPGGLPLGSQGRGLALVDSEAGMVAAWLAMKRGCRVTVATPDDSRAHEPLRRWDVHLKVLAWEAGIDVQDLVRVSRSEALFVGSRINEVEREKSSLDVPLFHPTIGLDDTRLRELADRVRSA